MDIRTDKFRLGRPKRLWLFRPKTASAKANYFDRQPMGPVDQYPIVRRGTDTPICWVGIVDGENKFREVVDRIMRGLELVEAADRAAWEAIGERRKSQLQTETKEEQL